MADPGWGIASGFLEGTQQEQAIKLNTFAIEEYPVTVAKEKLSLQVAQQSFDAHNKMTQLMQQQAATIGGKTPIDDAASALLKMSAAATASGLPEEAIEYASKASTIQHQQEDIAYKNFEMAQKRNTQMFQVLDSVHNEQSWRQANATVEIMTGQKSPFTNTPYSPELIQQIRSAGITTLQKAHEDLYRAEAERSRVSAQLDKDRVPLVKAQTDAQQALADHRRKQDGGIGQVANSKTISAVTNALKSKYNELADDPATARTKAGSIAIDVERIMSDTGKTQPQAIEQAIQEAHRRGDLAGFTAQRAALGHSRDRPLPVPVKNGDMSKDPGDYKDNLIYDVPGKGLSWWDADAKAFHTLEDGDEVEDIEE